MFDYVNRNIALDAGARDVLLPPNASVPSLSSFCQYVAPPLVPYGLLAPHL